MFRLIRQKENFARGGTIKPPRKLALVASLVGAASCVAYVVRTFASGKDLSSSDQWQFVLRHEQRFHRALEM